MMVYEAKWYNYKTLHGISLLRLAGLNSLIVSKKLSIPKNIKIASQHFMMLSQKLKKKKIEKSII